MDIARSYKKNRRVTNKILVGNVAVGFGAPISVQSMTNTDTCNVGATVQQIHALEKVGVDIVRVSVPSMEAAVAFAAIKKKINVPLVADIHFDYKIALAVAKYGADCLRINPGNIGNLSKIKDVIASAKDHGIPIRIGINAGSLEKDIAMQYHNITDALLASAKRQIDYLDKENFINFKVSIKASDVYTAVSAYRALSTQIKQPLHIGITEAGGLRAGTVKSSVGLGILLAEGIGDTMRISLAADPVEEVKVAFDLLKSLGLRHRGVECIACPSCARQNFDVIGTVKQIEENLAHISKPLKISIIGCIVNGPGEAKNVDVAIVGGAPQHLVYIDGKIVGKVDTANLVEHVTQLVKNKCV